MSRAGGAGAPGPSAFVSISLFLAVGLGVMLPELVTGTSYSASFRYNIVWPEEIVAAIRAGDVYPRWLAGSWDGLGAPTFYFYPPLFFLIAGILGFAGLPVAVATSLASALFVAASGFTMQLWLREQVTPRLALAGALGWMLAPYRILDIYGRGALAEATIYASLPLVLFALSRIGRGDFRHIGALAGAYAMMLVGHLPVTLLATLTVIPAYALWVLWGQSEGRFQRLATGFAGGALGILLAAFFLIPSIALLRHVSADQLFTEFFSPESWFFFSGPGSIFAERVADGQFAVAILSIGYVLIGIGVATHLRDRPELAFWAGLSVVCFLMASGLVPQIWTIPLLAQVQFPSRMLVISEFVAFTLLALGWGQLWRGVLLLAGLAVTLASMLVLRIVHDRVQLTIERGGSDRATVLEEMREAPEYLPAGFPVALDAFGRADPSGIVLPRMPAVLSGEPSARIMNVRTDRRGGLSFSIRTDLPTEVTVRRFAFPGWRVERVGFDDRPKWRSHAGLVNWRVERGEHVYRLVRGPAPWERASWLVSCLALLSTVAIMLGLRKRTNTVNAVFGNSSVGRRA